jgi:hypothetical protein
MSDVERTRQQLDPVGTLGNRPLAVLLAAGAFYYGLTMTFRSLDQVSNLALAILSLLWLAAASLTVIVASSQHRAPFTRSSHVVVHLLALGSIALSVASQWGTNRMRDGITRSVRQDRVMILGRDVLPFFSSVLERDTITPVDRATAREIADSIRSLMVAEADRTWLEVVAGDDGVALDRVGHAVVDLDGRASWMVTDQRTALRALIVALLDEPTHMTKSLRIELSGTPSVTNGVLTARFDASDYLVRAAFAPYFAVMRIVFTGFQADFIHPTLTLKFSYEQR